MWKLKIADGGPWLKSGNNHIGRETWEFDQNNGSSEERDAVDAARAEFEKNRFRTRHSSDILARMQLAKENNFSLDLQKSKYETTVDTDLPTVTEIIVLYVTESLGITLSSEHRKEICRYLYNRQVLGVFEWSGVNPIPPELFLLPSLIPIQPGQLWDVAFAVQAILACNNAEEFGSTLKKSHNFIKASQIVDNPSGDFSRKYRHISKGGWAFQVADQGWQVSDCTAEALKALLMLSKFPSDIVGNQMETYRFHDAVNILLSLQILNMTEIYADIMVEHQ
ncbi:hypothetical protein ACQ4PT_017367 [Festuca glaucescens]